MSLLRSVLKHEVMPAMGCTEPVSVALAAAYASSVVGGKVWRVAITMDAGTFKNGMNVAIPGAEGAIGIPIAAALGALCGDPKHGLSVLRDVTKADLKEAKNLLSEHQVALTPDFSKPYLYIRVKVKTDKGEGIAKIVKGHTNLIELRKNGVSVREKTSHKKGLTLDAYKKKIKTMTLEDLIREVENATTADLKYIEEGIEMNLEASRAGMKYKGYAAEVKKLQDMGEMKDGLFSQVKIAVAAASDGRMAGMSLPVMSSGGSGNQGIVAILVPYLWGQHYKIGRTRILRSIALSHLINAYVKAFAGELSPICQCAIAAGVGAAAACVYQKKKDLKLIKYAIDTVANDLGGMFCNGANMGCAIKVASSAHSALSAAFSAADGYCVAGPNGIIGATAEETMQNLAEITSSGMGQTNQVILGIMKRQAAV